MTPIPTLNAFLGTAGTASYGQQAQGDGLFDRRKWGLISAFMGESTVFVISVQTVLTSP